MDNMFAGILGFVFGLFLGYVALSYDYPIIEDLYEIRKTYGSTISDAVGERARVNLHHHLIDELDQHAGELQDQQGEGQ